MEFVIDVNTWRCGADYLVLENMDAGLGFGPTRLLNKEGFMCCLGQIARQIGCSREAIMGIPQPLEKEEILRLFKYNKLYNLVPKAIGINDDIVTTITKKKKLLKELFGKDGHEIAFSDEIQPTTRFKLDHTYLEAQELVAI